MGLEVCWRRIFVKVAHCTHTSSSANRSKPSGSSQCTMRHLAAVLQQVRSCLLYTLLLLAPSPAVCKYLGYDLDDLQDLLKILKIPDLTLTYQLPAHAFINPRRSATRFRVRQRLGCLRVRRRFRFVHQHHNFVGPRIGSPTPQRHFGTHRVTIAPNLAVAASNGDNFLLVKSQENDSR